MDGLDTGRQRGRARAPRHRPGRQSPCAAFCLLSPAQRDRRHSPGTGTHPANIQRASTPRSGASTATAPATARATVRLTFSYCIAYYIAILLFSCSLVRTRETDCIWPHDALTHSLTHSSPTHSRLQDLHADLFKAKDMVETAAALVPTFQQSA